jgi:dihydroorotase
MITHTIRACIFFLAIITISNLYAGEESNTVQSKMQIRFPDDFHVHFRQGIMLHGVVNYTAAQFKRAMVMPNTEPPIKNGNDVRRYYDEIVGSIAPSYQGFEPLMTFKIMPTTTVEDVESVVGLVIAGKLYPDGVTTNSQGGVTDFRALYPVFSAMEKNGIVLSLHGEKPGEFCLDREAKFLTTLFQIVKDFPNLKIVLEHVSTKSAVEAVEQLPDTVAATITLHHLELTLDDIVGSFLQPHHFCKPIPKRYEDRDALLRAAFSGNSKFFFGSDSAPHLRERKECSEGCAGVFSAPVIIPSLIVLFEQHQHLDKLENFISVYGAQFYGLELNKGFLELVQEEWTVPSDCSGIVPYKAGKSLPWKVQDL